MPLVRPASCQACVVRPPACRPRRRPWPVPARARAYARWHRRDSERCPLTRHERLGLIERGYASAGPVASGRPAAQRACVRAHRGARMRTGGARTVRAGRGMAAWRRAARGLCYEGVRLLPRVPCRASPAARPRAPAPRPSRPRRHAPQLPPYRLARAAPPARPHGAQRRRAWRESGRGAARAPLRARPVAARPLPPGRRADPPHRDARARRPARHGAAPAGRGPARRGAARGRGRRRGQPHRRRLRHARRGAAGRDGAGGRSGLLGRVRRLSAGRGRAGRGARGAGHGRPHPARRPRPLRRQPRPGGEDDRLEGR